MMSEMNSLDLLTSVLTNEDLKFDVHSTNKESSASNTQTYKGEYRNGLYHGYGRLEIKDYGTYEGSFVDGEQSGYGQFKFDDGKYYAGHATNRQMHGYGILIFTDGTKYVGQFSNGYFHGDGILHLFNNAKYVGEFLNGKMHGYGCYIKQDSSHKEVYKGDFSNNAFCGFGTLKIKNIFTYTGEFQNGQYHGYGKYENKLNKLTLFGNFIQNEIIGNAKIVYEDRQTYNGPVNKCGRHGHGTMMYNNLSIFTG